MENLLSGIFNSAEELLIGSLLLIAGGSIIYVIVYLRKFLLNKAPFLWRVLKITAIIILSLSLIYYIFIYKEPEPKGPIDKLTKLDFECNYPFCEKERSEEEWDNNEDYYFIRINVYNQTSYISNDEYSLDIDSNGNVILHYDDISVSIDDASATESTIIYQLLDIFEKKTDIDMNRYKSYWK